jgi:transcription elongation factor GreA
MTSKRQLTRSGYEKLQREIRRLQEVDIPRVVEHLKEIRDDNVGNEEDPELNETMENKKRLEERLDYLQNVLNFATIIEDNDPHQVDIGDRVTLLDIEEDEELTLDLVDGVEITGDRRGVTAQSPAGKALLGKKIGDIVRVKAPAGVIEYKVLSFEPID